VETPSADRLAEKQAGRIFPGELMLLQSIVIEIPKADVAGHVNGETSADSRVLCRRYLWGRPLRSRLSFLSPSDDGYSNETREDSNPEVFHYEPFIAVALSRRLS
jgi:hypothetical protein